MGHETRYIGNISGSNILSCLFRIFLMIATQGIRVFCPSPLFSHFIPVPSHLKGLVNLLRWSYVFLGSTTLTRFIWLGMIDSLQVGQRKTSGIQYNNDKFTITTYSLAISIFVAWSRWEHIDYSILGAQGSENHRDNGKDWLPGHLQGPNRKKPSSLECLGWLFSWSSRRSCNGVS